MSVITITNIYACIHVHWYIHDCFRSPFGWVYWQVYDRTTPCLVSETFNTNHRAHNCHLSHDKMYTGQINNKLRVFQVVVVQDWTVGQKMYSTGVQLCKILDMINRRMNIHLNCLFGDLPKEVVLIEINELISEWYLNSVAFKCCLLSCSQVFIDLH